MILTTVMRSDQLVWWELYSTTRVYYAYGESTGDNMNGVYRDCKLVMKINRLIDVQE